MPAEIITAPAGCAARTASAISRQPRERRGRAGTPSGATAMTPPSARPSSAAIASASSGTSGAPHRRPGVRVARPGSTWTRQRHGRPAAGRACPRAPDQPQPVHRVHDVGVARHARGLVGLQLADEVPGQGQHRPQRTRRPWAPPPGPGSPRRRVTPSSVQEPDVGRGKVLVTAISVTSAGSGRPPRRQRRSGPAPPRGRAASSAGVIRGRAGRLAHDRHGREPDQASEPAGAAVTPVGVKVSCPRRAPPSAVHLAHPGRASCAWIPAAMSSPGVPARVTQAVSGTAAATGPASPPAPRSIRRRCAGRSTAGIRAGSARRPTSRAPAPGRPRGPFPRVPRARRRRSAPAGRRAGPARSRRTGPPGPGRAPSEAGVPGRGLGGGPAPEVGSRGPARTGCTRPTSAPCTCRIQVIRAG